MMAYTDLDGNVKISVPANFNKEVKISFIAFEDKKVSVEDLKKGKIELSEE